MGSCPLSLVWPDVHGLLPGSELQVPGGIQGRVWKEHLVRTGRTWPFCDTCPVRSLGTFSPRWTRQTGISVP